MKIAICGSHSCGKTTLVEALYKEMLKRGHSVGLVTESARDVAAHDRSSIYAQYYIMDTQLIREWEVEEKFEHVLGDRCIIDNLAYTMLNMQHRRNQNRTSVLELCYRKFYENIDSYDLFIFVDEICDLVDDGFRDTDRRWQIWVYKQMKLLLESYVPEGKIVRVRGDTPTRMKVIDRIEKLVGKKE